jgi:hypothetical protein
MANAAAPPTSRNNTRYTTVFIVHNKKLNRRPKKDVLPHASADGITALYSHCRISVATT